MLKLTSIYSSEKLIWTNLLVILRLIRNNQLIAHKPSRTLDNPERIIGASMKRWSIIRLPYLRTAVEFIVEVSRRNLFFSTVNFADSSFHPRRLQGCEFTFKFPMLGKVRKPVPRLGSCPTSLYMCLTLELNPVERPTENDEKLPASTVKLGPPYRISTSSSRLRESLNFRASYSEDLGLPSLYFEGAN